METTRQKKKLTSAELLAYRVLEYAAEKAFPIGTHIKEVELASALKVSRTPIRGALLKLQHDGYLVKKPYHGFFLQKVPEVSSSSPLVTRESERINLDAIIYRIGQDYLSGNLSRGFTENELINRYDLGRKSIQQALFAMEKDGWLTRNIGYGWEFNEFISSPKAYAQSYRFRQLIEPEALRDPNFTIDCTRLQMLKMSQIDILNNDKKLVSAADMFNAGVLFHETIVAMSGNVFLLDALKRVNRLRRLVEYNVNGKRPIPRQECEEHIQLISMIEQAKLAEAAEFLEKHLSRTAQEKELIAKSIFG